MDNLWKSPLESNKTTEQWPPNACMPLTKLSHGAEIIHVTFIPFVTCFLTTAQLSLQSRPLLSGFVALPISNGLRSPSVFNQCWISSRTKRNQRLSDTFLVIDIRVKKKMKDRELIIDPKGTRLIKTKKRLQPTILENCFSFSLFHICGVQFCTANIT